MATATGPAAPTDACYMLIHPRLDVETPNLQTLKRNLERGTDDIKAEALQQVISGTLQGENHDQLLMHIIRFVMPTRNKTLKKLLLLYWEVCPKYEADGKLKQETILICNALLNDLQHPNEFIRGSTLRFLCKLREAELLEPLIGPTRECLSHRHAYVRKNAVEAVSSIYRTLPHLIPDGPELISGVLQTEADMTCRRNALTMLTQSAPALAVQWLKENAQLVSGFEELLQLAVIDLIRRTARDFASEKALFIRCIFELLNAAPSAVKYEAATTLVTLSSNPAAVKAAASCYITLATKESDNNVRIIVLERLDRLRARHEGIIDDLVMDLLRVLTAPDLDVRRKVLGIVMKLTSQRNVNDVISMLKKELAKTVSDASDYDKNTDYRLLVIQTIHSCASQFPEVAASVVELFLDSIADFGASSATDAIVFIREVAEKFPDLRQGIVSHLVASFMDFKAGKVMRGALWILGEYAETPDEIREVWTRLRKAIGELPLLAAEQRELDAASSATAEGAEKSAAEPKAASSGSHRILADGTYATESSLTARATEALSLKLDSKPPLRAVLLHSDFFTGTVLASTLTKLVLRFARAASADEEQQVNSLRAEAVLIMAGIIRIGQSSFVATPIDEDSYDRVLACIRALEYMDEDADVLTEAFIDDTQSAFARLVKGEVKRVAEEERKHSNDNAVQVDDVIEFRLLAAANKGASVSNAEDTLEHDIELATGEAEGRAAVSKLDSVVQLTGFSDAVYAEAYVNVNQYDILLDVMVVNQTNTTLRNLSIEFSTLGDLKLVEKPTTYNVAPFSFSSVKASIKVSSTETGVIFGTIVYDGPNVNDSHSIVLNDIHVDIMEYIRPARCDEAQFHAMWTEFEWENKVNMSTTKEAAENLDLRGYLQHIMRATNMACLTPANALAGDCGFLSANLYARSIFGEDALANISIEKPTEESPITGHIRIRAKTQGIALSLGDKISAAKVSLSE
ncbi:coatomer subunit beta [Coemansia sp. RSA 1822]|nr:coatomer subunit beta [Coemansia sp. RSA 638]KAJ2121763.1 coatomer subunit beta [Coemansia sp. RSA 720]KAJ2540324.1 coatomer subunit beta [Coemansia sp. RSA 1853]KAJ2560702.1 coatomer subunit beta [Coemansia sp. RSA 1822]